MPKLHIPVGIPGCGKSTFANVITHVNMRVVETDAIRLEMVKEGLLESVNDMSRNHDVFERFYARIEDYLLDGLDVYADNTALQPFAFARERLRKIADSTGAQTHVFVFVNPSAAVARNTKRERVVPPEAMVRMLDQYEKMLTALPTESYTSVTYIEATA